eukprot:4143295-Prymnesium_polylepis.1
MEGATPKYGRRDLLRVPAICKDGAKISVEFSLQLIHDDGGAPIGSFAMLRDVSLMSGTIRSLRVKIAELEKNLKSALAQSGAARDNPYPKGGKL